jgi:hypothetical protein
VDKPLTDEDKWWLYFLWMWCKIGRCVQVFTIMIEQVNERK